MACGYNVSLEHSDLLAAFADPATHFEETERQSAAIDTTRADQAVQSATHLLSQSGLI